MGGASEQEAERPRDSNPWSKGVPRLSWPLPNPFANPGNRRGVHSMIGPSDDVSKTKPQTSLRDGETDPNKEKTGSVRLSFFGLQLPGFKTAPDEQPKLVQTARISANPLVWANRKEKPNPLPKESSNPKPDPKPAPQTLPPSKEPISSNPSQKGGSNPNPESKPPSKAELLRGGQKMQPTEGGGSSANQLFGQTEAVLDSVKSAMVGISSNVMDNLPPLRKTAYPDRKKLSSVQEFYRYTEAEGRRLFEELDADRDGNVTLEDLEAAMRRRRLPQEYARKFLRKVRRTMFAKSFTWEEFSALMDEREPAILRAYNSLDLNSAGTLQRSQIKASLQRNGLPTTDRNINAMMRFLTGEADGQIAYGQFRNFLLLLPPERLRDHPSTVWFEAATVVPLYAPAVATGSVLKSALAGGLACAIPTFFLHPVDTMKTRVQASTMSLRDLVDQLPQIGARGLYRGAVPAIAGQFAGQGLRTGMLEASKAVLKNVAPDIPEMQVQSLASFTSTFMGTALRIPCEVIKQRCQAGLYDSWQAAAVGTYRSDGLPGFFRGTTATLLREVPFYVAGMMIYEQIKKGVRKGIRRELKPWETITVGGVSGGLAAVTTTPFDVLKTRMMTAEPGVATSMGATFVHILKNEGVMALYKGALPRFFWIAPLGAMNFAGYELAKRAMEDQDRRQAREAEAAAEAELQALEEAEEMQRRSPFGQFSKLPDLKEQFPQVRTALADFRTRLAKPRASGDRVTISRRVKGLVNRISRRKLGATGEGTEGKGRVEESDVGEEKGTVERIVSQPLKTVERREENGRTGVRGLVARIEGRWKGEKMVGDLARQRNGGKDEGIDAEAGVRGLVEGDPGRVGSGTDAERVAESEGPKNEALLPGTADSSSKLALAAEGETRPASVLLESKAVERRGFLAGVSVPNLFKRPQKAGSNEGLGPAERVAGNAIPEVKGDAESEDDAKGLEGPVTLIAKESGSLKK